MGKGIIDFHTHSLLSDGELIPSELAARALAKGYRALGIADHVDGSNADMVIPHLVEVCRQLSKALDITVVAGAELTHVPPALISPLARQCRDLGVEYLIVHGETIVEPVAPGTNAAALDAPIDILAHPGLITAALARRAAERGILLELSARTGHCFTNGHVACCARSAGARLIIGSDAHGPGGLLDGDYAERVALGAGLSPHEAGAMRRNAECLLKRIVSAR
ncbi:MAG: histidinol phosphate phosphatase domain-containing protein [Candidatus Aureabacteria bacterium]|nr:histidinol phosphate phosphatase domain-containing protein [Candidatus Auribacterota bacterium]